MRIGIFIQPLSNPVLNGPNMALQNICYELQNLSSPHDILFLTIDPPVNECNYVPSNITSIPRLPLLAQRAIKARKIDILFLNGIPNRLTSLLFHFDPRVAKVVYVHGTMAWLDQYLYESKPRKLGHRAQLNTYFTKALVRCSAKTINRFATNSEFTKNFLIKSVRVNPKICEVIPLGVDHSVFHYTPSDASFPDGYGLSRPFIVSTANYRSDIDPKNLVTAIKTFLLLRANGHNLQYVIVGEGWTFDKLRKISEVEIPEADIILAGRLAPSMIATLLNHAVAYLHPALQETFGLSILEAMACGCPVVTTNWSGIPELTSDAALLANNPLDPEELFYLMQRILNDDALRRVLRLKGQTRAKTFQWKSTARQLMKLFADVLNEEHTDSGL